MNGDKIPSSKLMKCTTNSTIVPTMIATNVGVCAPPLSMGIITWNANWLAANARPTEAKPMARSLK